MSYPRAMFNANSKSATVRLGINLIPKRFWPKRNVDRRSIRKERNGTGVLNIFK